MPQAIIITLEKDLPQAMATYMKAGAGKALAREEPRLDLAARTQKVPVLATMLSESPAALAEQLRADGFDPAKMRLPPERWFSASEGLSTVRALVEYVGANLNDFKQPNPLLRDLRAAEALLSAAESAGTRFHFTRAAI